MNSLILVLLFAPASLAQDDSSTYEREPSAQEETSPAKVSDQFIDVDQLMKNKGEEVKSDFDMGEGDPAATEGQ